MKPKIKNIIKKWLDILNKQEEKLTIKETIELQEEIKKQLLYNCLKAALKLEDK